MISGFYAVGGAMRTYADRNDIIANNLANASTPGFKKESVHVEPFDVLFARVTQPVGDSEGLVQPPLGRLRAEVITVHTQGPLRETGGAFDLAIDGDGFFRVRSPEGTRYTRDGSFHLDAGGRLVTADGYGLLGDGGAPITISTAEGGDVAIAPDGTISINGARSGRITLADFEQPYPLRKAGQNLYETTSEDAVELTVSSPIVQGSIEMSNVNVVEEMVGLIGNYRDYEMAQKMARLQDDTLSDAIRTVGAAR
ncbi:MAG: flagellar basal-body rod protein FlgF [Verrucomicrobia bacterium]|nr:flagellar basal-body rod protein FlgF [Verrucomicrobiota bacterium]